MSVECQGAGLYSPSVVTCGQHHHLQQGSISGDLEASQVMHAATFASKSHFGICEQGHPNIKL